MLEEGSLEVRCLWSLVYESANLMGVDRSQRSAAPEYQAAYEVVRGYMASHVH